MHTYSLCLLIAISYITGAATNNQCYQRSADFYPYMGTRTPYHFVGGTLTRPRKTCEALQVWALIRHGTRYLLDVELPSYGIETLKEIREEIVKNHRDGAGNLCDKDLKRISTWSFSAKMQSIKVNDLTPLGIQEMVSLGERLKRIFPEILLVDPDKVEPNDFLFQASNTTRTISSLKNFQEGLLKKNIKFEGNVPLTNDPLLEAHASCPAWQAMKFFPADEINVERDIFTNSSQFLKLQRDVSDRLGYQDLLTFEKIRPMYEMCRFEAAWFPNVTSTWCVAFSKEDLKKLEYREDLNYYYCCGPGQEMAPKLGCLTLKDMFSHFEKVANGVKSEPRGIFYFDHTLTIQALMAALEVSKYPVFDGSSYETAENRTYHNSLAAAFGTNFLSVLYKCDDGYKVQFQMAERVVPMRGCDEEGLCDWDKLKSDYAKIIKSCNLDFCYENITKTMLEQLEAIANQELDGKNGSDVKNSGFEMMKMNFVSIVAFALIIILSV